MVLFPSNDSYGWIFGRFDIPSPFLIIMAIKEGNSKSVLSCSLPVLPSRISLPSLINVVLGKLKLEFPKGRHKQYSSVPFQYSFTFPDILPIPNKCRFREAEAGVSEGETQAVRFCSLPVLRQGRIDLPRPLSGQEKIEGINREFFFPNFLFPSFSVFFS